MKRLLYKTIAVIAGLLLMVILFVSYTNYSTGTRAGVVVKISKKGFVFKTFEGQLNVGGLAKGNEGVVPAAWDFSVKRNKEEVIDALEDAQLSGERVKLYYKEKLYKFPWIGDTKYYVYRVETVKGTHANTTAE